MLQKILPLPVSNLQKQTWLGLSSCFFIDLALDDSHLVLVRNVETWAQIRPQFWKKQISEIQLLKSMKIDNRKMYDIFPVSS